MDNFVNDTRDTTEKTGQSEALRLSDREVMEHTASIWQYKEIVDDKTELHTESHKKRTVCPLGEITAARVRGKKHKHEGTNCDDYFETAVTDDCIIAVVCDGAGSRRLSRIGARASCESAAAFLKEKLAELFRENPKIRAGLCTEISSAEFTESCTGIASLLQDAAKEAFCAQQRELAVILENEDYKAALGRNPEIGDLAATFLAAAAIPLVIDGKPQTFLACVQIGDGCICALSSAANSAECLKILGEPDSGAFSGETDFLSEKSSGENAVGAKTRVSRGAYDTVMLMTDGVADDYFPAQPMMKRLYIDLCLNGILPFSGECKGEGEDPAPIRFNSVSMSRKSVALQYSKQLLAADSSSDAVNALWDKREMLYCHSLEAFKMSLGETADERLEVWLDNYNERGSFDDRTLAVIKINQIKQD